MDPKHDEDLLIGRKCTACGHPAGAHSHLTENDLDNPDAEENQCTVTDCACNDYRD